MPGWRLSGGGGELLNSLGDRFLCFFCEVHSLIGFYSKMA